MYMTEPYFFLKKDTLRWDFMFYLRYLFGILCGNWGENKAGGYRWEGVWSGLFGDCFLYFSGFSFSLFLRYL